MNDLLEYYKDQNREQRQTINENEETIKLIKRADYEVKQSIYEQLIKIRKIGQSNDIYKNMKMSKILNNLIDDLYHDIQEELEEQLNEENKKELVDLPNQN